jgi:hypothetical protein
VRNRVHGKSRRLGLARIKIAQAEETGWQLPNLCRARSATADRAITIAHAIRLYSLLKKSEMFVGRGFSRDIKAFVSSGVLTPEWFRVTFSAACLAAGLFKIALPHRFASPRQSYSGSGMARVSASGTMLKSTGNRPAGSPSTWINTCEEVVDAQCSELALKKWTCRALRNFPAQIKGK